MTALLPRDAIEAAFVEACLKELRAIKPGNVHIHAAGHGMDVRHFEDAARAAAPFVADPSLAPGRRIETAVEASFSVAKCNTNLGILLLTVPLAVAVGTHAPAVSDLRQRVVRVLDRLDRDDAEHVFRAIVIANPAGLGRTDAGDVAEPATITLKEAMALAAARDRIANAYITSFEDIFEFGLPKLYAARAEAGSPEMATSLLHMAFLARFPDSHIARKHGLAAAQRVQADARKSLDFLGSASTVEAEQQLLGLDRALKEQGLNPGTTADFVVATLFADLLIAQTATKARA